MEFYAVKRITFLNFLKSHILIFSHSQSSFLFHPHNKYLFIDYRIPSLVQAFWIHRQQNRHSPCLCNFVRSPILTNSHANNVIRIANWDNTYWHPLALVHQEHKCSQTKLGLLSCCYEGEHTQGWAMEHLHERVFCEVGSAVELGSMWHDFGESSRKQEFFSELSALRK